MPASIRTALFGGTFDPLHNGHLTIAKSVLEQGLADEVWLLVTPCNPWKKDSKLLDDKLRYNMVAEAVKDMEGINASDYEFNLPKPSYSANTLRRISADYPDRQFILTIGADNWTKFNNWRDSNYILENYPIIVYPRKGCPIGEHPATVTILDMPLINLSSTEIRNLIKHGEPIDHLVPASIAQTIAEKGFYTELQTERSITGGRKA
ncbi:MAG: nicotinate-nucleotide adenylyltransferase [Bacteroidaceae bacterium]|nr:nicotinate-nucleotide adenylyltransferase [Bacteroidaceae bacterium]